MEVLLAATTTPGINCVMMGAIRQVAFAGTLLHLFVNLKESLIVVVALITEELIIAMARKVG
jgi:hypothetical protein